MMVASIDTTTGRTTLFALPRNIGNALFPPAPTAPEFPKGFHNPSDPLSGDYLLNAVYAWARDYPRSRPAAHHGSGPEPAGLVGRDMLGSRSTTTSR